MYVREVVDVDESVGRRKQEESAAVAKAPALSRQRRRARGRHGCTWQRVERLPSLLRSSEGRHARNRRREGEESNTMM